MQSNYSVRIETYAERHFIKTFERKYKNNWDVTLKALIFQLEHIDSLLMTDKAEVIRDKGEVKIIKTKFKIAKSAESANSSGNRCVIAWHPKDRSVSILLVYGKTDLSGHNETVEWQTLIKENYPEYNFF